MTPNTLERANGPAGAVMLLWQGPPEQAPQGEGVVLWEGAAPDRGALSLTEYLDRHGEEIRRRYLAWAHDLGRTQILGRALCERFMCGRAGSLWALSLFVEQSIWNQHSLEKILKVLAFERLLAASAPAAVRFAGYDRDLGRVLRALCRQRNLDFTSSDLSRPRGRQRTRLRRALPHLVRGIAAQAYFLLTRLSLPRPAAADGAAARRVLLCAPFFNHNAERHDAREFTSRYWTALPRLLIESGWHVHWLHVFYPHDKIPNGRAAAQVLRRVQRDSAWSGSHSFVEAYLPLSAFARIAAHWCGCVLESLLVGAQLKSRFARTPQESFWPLLRRDFASAFRGVDCVMALVYAESFGRALQRLPREDEGLYLMENQGWERALARAWSAHGHGRLAGMAHSTIRFWDLRYHCDPRRYEPSCRRLLPGPGVVIVNGRAARRSYLATSGIREKVVECEALRYLHLTRGAPRKLDRQEVLRLLVLGDFLRESTDRMLCLVAGAREAAAQPLQVWVKPHPNCPVDGEQYPGLQLHVVNDAVPQVVPAVHLVLASNTTSAAVDAYIGGGRILVYDDQRGVNLSPLRGLQGVTFVHSAADLAQAIDGLSSGGAGEPQQKAEEFFNIDPRLTLWRQHFELRQAAERQLPEMSSSS
jgi:surface carbohydrate biosynthesis protein (TIGR04326 family)